MKPAIKPKRARRSKKNTASSPAVLRDIARGASISFDKDFFHSLTQYIARTLDMDYAFVAELAQDDKDMAQVLGGHFSGRSVSGFTYRLKDTPCSGIFRKKFCVYPQGVRQRFPGDKYLARLKAECYAGVPLLGSAGKPLGLLVVMDRKPLQNREAAELLLNVMAARAAAEIERRHVYGVLGESHRTLSTLMTNLPGLVYRCRNDKDWSMEFISEGCLALTGYKPEDFISGRIQYGGLIHPDDRDPVWDEVQAAVKKRRPFQLVYRVTTASGKLKWVWEQGSGVFSPNADLLALEGFVSDITERRRADEALSKSESRLRSIVRTALNVIIVLSSDHRILEFNPEAERVYGRRREEVLGKDYFELFLPRDAWKAVEADLRSVMTGKETRGFENNVRTANGGRRRMIWNVSRLDDAAGQGIGIVAIGHDITEQRRTEEAASQRERLLHTVLEALPVGVWIADAQGRLVSTNPAGRLIWAGARYVGVDQYDEYKGWWAGTGKPITADEWGMARAIKKGEVSLNEVIDIECFDGARKTILHSALPLRGLEGEITGAVVVNQDITELRRAEAALRESEARLKEAQRIAHVGSWEFDLARNRLNWSDEIFRIFEIDPQRFSPSYEAFLDKVHPDDRESVNRAYTGSVRNRAPYDISHRLQMPDGRIKYVHERCVNYYSEEGAPLRSVGTVQDITERVLGEQALRRSEERLRIIYDASPVVISVSRLADGQFLEVNPTFLRIGGWTREEVIGRTSFDLGVWVAQNDREKILEGVRAHGAVREMEVSFRAKSGEIRLMLCSVELIQLEQGPCLLLIGQDITERKKALAQMQKLSRALQQTADAVLITDHDGVIEYVNPAFEHVTGYIMDEAVGRKPNILKSGRQGQGFYDNLWKTILAGEVFNDVLINRRKDGSLYYEEKTITPIKDADGCITHFVATGKDITERMQTQERLAFMAQHDPLTELPNRTLLLDRLKQSLAGARWRERRAAVLFVDLDRFKTINDTLGHEVGDRLLQQLAERFQRSVREGDTVARFGGDEFVILLDDVASEDDVSGVAQKVLQALAPPFQVDHQTLYVTASIGVSLFPNDGDDATTLLKNADIAMYRAKELGKNTYQFYSPDMSSRAFERLTLESNLRRALEREEFRLYYQPQIDVATGAIVGVEALLRWQHPEFGLVMPNDFITLLEETGLIVPTGEWVLQAACSQLAAWHAQGWPRLRMAVNLSPRQFQTQSLAAAVEQALNRMDGDPGRLELEITEGMLLRHAPATIETLEALHALGVRMAIDDFGTGYSSLSYLRRLLIDTLKIDRSFVRDIPHDTDDSAITAAIIALAQSLKLEMIAEGVENVAQRDFLRSHGCGVMQGYLFSRPLPAEDITRLLQSGMKT